MYHLWPSADMESQNRGETIQYVVEQRCAIPFGRVQLAGDPRVLSWYSSGRQFIPRLALACFPSLNPDGPSQIIAGSFCDWLKPNIGKMHELAFVLRPVMSDELLDRADAGYRMRLDYTKASHRTTTVEREVGALCALQGLPIATISFESVDDDCPERRRPERAILNYPKLLSPETSLHALRMTLDVAPGSN